jgi:ribosomal protein L7Ae-like RNA K-turn-binding protein
MNRKLLYNDQLSWPDICTDDNDQILRLIQEKLNDFPQLKRKKNLSKRIRKEKEIDAKNETITTTTTEPTDDIKLTKYIKKHLRFGINSVTKSLERYPNHVEFVLVCNSCKPFVYMTRHLQIMCFHNNVSGGSIKNLSKTLAKYFNFKMISAFAICSPDPGQKNLLNGDQLVKMNDYLKGLCESVVKLLPNLKNPLKLLNNIKTEQVMNEIELFKS